MFELAQGFGEGPVLMGTVADRQDLSRKHLHALLTALKSAGLVRSVRGPGGGFVLTRPPAEIRLSEILHALEGPMSLVDCVADKGACRKASRCPARRVWQELSGAIENVLDNATLEDMTAPRDKKCPGHGTRKTDHRPRTRGRSPKPRGAKPRSHRLKAGRK